jgi:Uma2 family endonuclease
MGSGKTTFSLQEFLDLPDSGDRSELVNGEIISKVSPKYEHSIGQLRLLGSAKQVRIHCSSEQSTKLPQ